MRTSECSQFDGSAWFSQGQSAAQAILHGPVQAKNEEYDTCALRVAIHHAAAVAPMAGGAGRLIAEECRREVRSRIDAFELEQLVESAVDAVFLRERFPRCVLVIDVTVVQNDGSLAAVVINAVMCALLDAGLPCRTTVAAVCVAALRPSRAPGVAAPSSSSSPPPSLPSAGGAPPSTLEYVLDPSLFEEDLEAAATAGDREAVAPSSSPSLLQKNESRLHQDLYACVGTGVFVFANLKGGGGIVAHQVRRAKAASHAKQQQQQLESELTISSYAKMSALAERAAGVLFDFFRQCNAPLE